MILIFKIIVDKKKKAERVYSILIYVQILFKLD